jgi:2-polyprenyl-3-methyl-5-hydroxy-6-metoxy-1,4-benzoquinol methylase
MGDRLDSENWLHGVLKRNFDTVIGIDISEEVLELRKYGYEVYVVNAEDFDLDRKFETIVVGELIEHLSNPGKFLECAKKTS